MSRVIWTVSLAMVATLALSVSALAQEPRRFSLSMFHYNIQYVAGGLVGFPSGDDYTETFDLDDTEVQDRIVRESFEPVLDLFLAHPSWKVSLEMQANMGEVMEARHPDVLDKLRELVAAGRAELVSFHYSDQLFLAYPRLDLERSLELADAVWARLGITPSPVVFCQEGQFSMGMAGVALEHGRHILVLPTTSGRSASGSARS